MPWFRIDDGWHSHPKVMMAGNAAAGLWARCGTYCAQHNLEGRVPHVIADQYGTRKEVERLLAVGLWVLDGDVYVMPDWLDYNPSAEQVKSKRKADAERQRRAREAASSRRESQRDTEASHGVDDGPPDPTRPDPTLVTGCTETTDDLQSAGPSSVVVEVAHHMAELLWKHADVHPSKHGRWVESTEANIIRERTTEIERASLRWAHIELAELADGLVNDRWPPPVRLVPAEQVPPQPPKPAVSQDDHIARVRVDAANGDPDAIVELATWEKRLARKASISTAGAL